MPNIEIAADLSGSDSFVADISFDPVSLSATFQGNASFTANITEGIVFSSTLILQGNGTLTAQGGVSDGLVTVIEIAANLEGAESFVADGTLVIPDVEEPPEEEEPPPEEEEPPEEEPPTPTPTPSSCEVTYDIETCRCVTI